MKKLIIAATLLFAGLSTNAQVAGDFEFGFGIGPSLSNVSTSEANTNTDLRFAFNFGGSAEYYFSDEWGIKLELLYDSKGWGDGFMENLDTSERITTDFKLNYLTIPVLANWHFGGSSNWYMNFGPYVGFLLSAEDSELGIDLKDGFKSTDFGIALGIGYRFYLNEKVSLFAEFDSQSGFVDIFEQNSGDSVRIGRSSINFGVIIRP